MRVFFKIFQAAKILAKNIKFICSHSIRNAHKQNEIYNTKIPSPCFLGESVKITDSVVEPYAGFANHSDTMNSKICSRSFIGRYTIVRNSDIGRCCDISWFVTIGADSHPFDRISGSAAFFQSRFDLCKEDISKGMVPRTKIGNDVWIGCHAIIKAGVEVGNGAIIGAGSIVTKDVPPYAIVAGNPARILRYRFDEETIEQLLQISWWDKSDDFIRERIECFQQPLTQDVIEKLQNSII